MISNVNIKFATILGQLAAKSACSYTMKPAKSKIKKQNFKKANDAIPPLTMATIPQSPVPPLTRATIPPAPRPPAPRPQVGQNSVGKQPVNSGNIPRVQTPSVLPVQP